MLTPSVPEPPEGASLPRKHPQQARSQITVEAILEAAAQLLTADGYEAMGMVEVAERAGVSVGSLYQYYPDKAALVGGVIEAHLSHEAEALAGAFDRAQALPLGDAIENLVRAYVGVNAKDPERSAALIAAAPHAVWADGVDGLAGQSVEAVGALFRARAGESRVRDPEAAAYVVATAVHALVQRAAAQRPGLLASGRLADEAADLARRYLVAESER